jgi:quercetin dioxygenase-like cupin family protein
MRRFVTLLNPPGVPLAVSGQGSFTPKKGPSSVFPTSRGTVAEAPSEFDFAQALFSLDAGATSAPYTTSGYSAWTVISGEVSVKVAGKATNYSPGGFFLLTPGQDAVVSNPGAKEAQLAASIMVAPGAPISTLVAASGASPAIKPPSTGDGGLR